MSESLKRVRSPNYPAISLAEAVEKLGALHERIHKHPAPKEAIAKALGYKGWNGTSGAIVSAHTKFGLLDRVDAEQFKLTERAMRIIAPKSRTEKLEALREAALAPALYAELVADYGEQPPHDDILRPWLIRRGFAPSAVGGVIQGYRDTMAVVEPTEEGSDPSGVQVEDRPIQVQAAEPGVPSRGPTKAGALVEAVAVMQRPAKSSFEVRGMIDRLDVSGVLLDQQAADKLIAFLQMAKTTLPQAIEDTPKPSSSALES